MRIPIKSSTGAIERRGGDRLELKVSVTAGSDSNFYLGMTENISRGGLFISTSSMPDVGTTMEINLELPDGGPPMRVVGEVRWHKKHRDNEGSPGYGLRFVSLSIKDEARIRDFTGERQPIVHPEG
jgi:uncharacterized protein (TIGR02266 family)